MKRIETQVDLPAAPAVGRQQLVDAQAMGSLNPFITSLSGVLAVGERLKVRIAPAGGRPMTFKPRVTVVEPGQRLEWVGTMGVGTLRRPPRVHAAPRKPAHPTGAGRERW